MVGVAQPDYIVDRDGSSAAVSGPEIWGQVIDSQCVIRAVGLGSVAVVRKEQVVAIAFGEYAREPLNGLAREGGGEL